MRFGPWTITTGLLFALTAASGCGSSNPAACGGASQPCCAGTACDSGLSCELGSCRGSTSAGDSGTSSTGASSGSSTGSSGRATGGAGASSGSAAGGSSGAAASSAGGTTAATSSSSGGTSGGSSSTPDAGQPCPNACSPGFVCLNGACQCADGGVPDCFQQCRDPQTDSNYCGPDHTVCEGSCMEGHCVCPTGFGPCALPPGQISTACGSAAQYACVADTTIGCGNACVSCGADSTCLTGSCACTVTGQVFCDAGCTVGYGGQPYCSGACTTTDTDPTNCGSCGQTCPTGSVCSAGSCVAGGVVILASNQANPTSLAVANGSVYWLNAGTLGANGFSLSGLAVMSVPVDGGAPVTLAQSYGLYRTLAVDQDAVYWSGLAWDAGTGAPWAVLRTPLDGGSTVELTPLLGTVTTLAVDGQAVYWAEQELEHRRSEFHRESLHPPALRRRRGNPLQRAGLLWTLGTRSRGQRDSTRRGWRHRRRARDGHGRRQPWPAGFEPAVPRRPRRRCERGLLLDTEQQRVRWRSRDPEMSSNSHWTVVPPRRCTRARRRSRWPWTRPRSTGPMAPTSGRWPSVAAGRSGSSAAPPARSRHSR